MPSTPQNTPTATGVMGTDTQERQSYTQPVGMNGQNDSTPNETRVAPEPASGQGVAESQPMPPPADPFPPLPPHTTSETATNARARKHAPGRTAKGKGRAASKAAARMIGRGAPPQNRLEPQTSSTTPRTVSKARKRRRAEEDVEGDTTPGSLVSTVVTPARNQTMRPSATGTSLPDIHPSSAARRDNTPSPSNTDDDIEMDVPLPQGDEGELDTHRMMYCYNVNPYDIHARHMPPPVIPPPQDHHNSTNGTEHDPANLRTGHTTPTTIRVAPSHLTQAYRTELDEQGNVRPSHPGPPTRIPNTRPPASGEFGYGADFDERAFRAAIFHAPPYQLRPGSEYERGRQGGAESPAAYLRRLQPEPPILHTPTASHPSYHSTAIRQHSAHQNEPSHNDDTIHPIARPNSVQRVGTPFPQRPNIDQLHAQQEHPTHPAIRQLGAWRNLSALPAGPSIGSLTPTPQGGWRVIQGDNPLWKFSNQNAEQVSAWMNDDTPSCLAHIPGLGATDEGRWVRRGHIESVLRKYLGDESITVTLPTPSNPQPRRNAAPYFYLVRAADHRAIKALTDMIWLSSIELTIGFIRLDLDPPTLVAAFQDIHAFVATTEAGIADLVIDALIAMADIIVSIIIDDIANNGRWQAFSALEAFDHILHSVRVRIIHRKLRGDVIDPIALIYCQSPTADVGGWEAFCHHIQNYPFGSVHSGHPSQATTSLWCALCHSFDHPTGLCYLPDVPMWHGPTIAEVLAIQANPPPPPTSHPTRPAARTGGRGARRGRGRGGR